MSRTRCKSFLPKMLNVLVLCSLLVAMLAPVARAQEEYRVFLPSVATDADDSASTPEVTIAGTDSSVVTTGDGLTFQASFGSTEIDNFSSLINYVQVSVSMPGLRLLGTVCATVFIYSQEQLKIQNESCRDYRPGVAALTQDWNLYQPSNPNERVSIRRGQSKILVTFKPAYLSTFSDLSCGEDFDNLENISTASGLCETASISLFPPEPNQPVVTLLDGATFIADANLPDGSAVQPGQSYVKTWRLKNTGTSAWSTGYTLVFRSGQRLGAPTVVNVPVAQPGQTVEVSVPLQIPSDASGSQRGDWQLRNAQGTYFGPNVWYLLSVGSAQPNTGNASNGEVVGGTIVINATPGQHISPQIPFLLTSGQLREDRGDMIRHKSGSNYSDFPHIAVKGVVNAGQVYTFQFYADHPLVAPSTPGTYETVWMAWASGGWVGSEIRIQLRVYAGSDSRPPNRPTLTAPNNWAVPIGNAPALCAQHNGDPDGDAITGYRFVIYESGNNFDSGWVTGNCATPTGLNYYSFKWHAKVRDSRGVESDWSEDRNFSLESSTVTVTKLELNPPSPSGSEIVVISVDSSGCGGVGVGGDVFVNLATDGSANGEWRKIKDVPGPRTTDQDAPRWETIEYGEGLHLVRAVMKSCDGTISTRDTTYRVTRGKPSRPFLQAPTNAFWSDSRTLTFRWQPSMRVHNYTLLVGQSENLDATAFVRQTTTDTEFSITFDEDYPKLFWSVRANNEFGSTSPGTRWVAIDRTPPNSTINTAVTPALAYDNQMNLAWSGSDNQAGGASGIHNYDVQTRRLPDGEWTDWLRDYAHQSAIFSGQAGNTYCFRTRARDNAGNLAVYPDEPQHCVQIDPTQRPAQHWWDTAYAHQRPLVIANLVSNAPLPIGYPIRLHLDATTSPTAAEVYNGSQAGIKGQDVRVVFEGQTQIDRYIAQFTPTRVEIWFAVQANIAPNQSSSAYALYYSNPTPDSAPADLTRIMLPRPDATTATTLYFEQGSGNTLDLSGNGRNVTWVNNPMPSSDPGLFGSVMRLDGNQWGTLPPVNSDRLTVEAWVNFASLLNQSYGPRDWMGIVTAVDTSDNYMTWRLSLAGHDNGTSSLHGLIQIRDANGNHQERWLERSEIRIEPNKLYHIALTYDGSVVRLWINGDVVATSNVVGRIDYRMNAINIGRNQPQHPPMNGWIDGVSISTEAKTSFPYAKIAVAPTVAASQELGQESRGPADLVVQELVVVPQTDGTFIVQATVQNQGGFSTSNEFQVAVYTDQTPSEAGESGEMLNFWANAPLDPGATITLTTVLTREIFPISPGNQEHTFSLAAEADALNTIQEIDKSNNILRDVSLCLAEADVHEGNDTPQSASLLTSGASTTRNTHLPGDIDWLRFEAQAGQSYVISTTNLSYAADTVLTLFDVDGVTELASNDDYAGTLASRIEWSAAASGIYFIQIKHWHDLVGGCDTGYSLTLALPDVPTPTPSPTATPDPTATPTPSPTPPPFVPVGGVELLPDPWQIANNSGAAEADKPLSPDALVGKDTLRVTFDLHGATSLCGDAAALALVQGEWRYVELGCTHGTSALDGMQTIDIPLQDFPGLDLDAPITNVHLRWWSETPFTITVQSIIAYSSPTTPSPTSFEWLLIPGWHLISIPLRVANNAIGQVLQSISGHFDAASAFDGCAVGEKWRTFNPELPFVNTLQSLDPNQGLWLHITVTTTLTISGTAPTITSMTLCPGWNLLPWPRTTPMPATPALQSISGCHTQVYEYRNELGQKRWRTLDPAIPFASDLTTFTPGYGYWVYAQQPCTWTLDPAP